MLRKYIPQKQCTTGLKKIINNLIRNIQGTFSMHFGDAIKWNFVGCSTLKFRMVKRLIDCAVFSILNIPPWLWPFNLWMVLDIPTATIFMKIILTWVGFQFLSHNFKVVYCNMIGISNFMEPHANIALNFI